MNSRVYSCLCSLNRCYFFFVLRCLSLQTSSFPLEWQVGLPQHSDCQDVVVPPQIWVLFCCYLLSDDRCYFVCGFRVRLLSVPLSIRFNRPFLVDPLQVMHPKQEVRAFIFIFGVSDTGEGRVIKLDYTLMCSGSDDIHIFRNYVSYTSYRMKHFQVRISTCDFTLRGVLHGDTFFI